jgi:hypothetical protein
MFQLVLISSFIVFPVQGQSLLSCCSCSVALKFCTMHIVVLEQRENIKFCFKTGKTATETLQLTKQAYGDNAVSRTRGSERYLNRLNDLKTCARIFKMIHEAGVLQTLEMHTQSQMFVEL